MNFESSNKREKVSLKDLFSPEPVHGLGYERFDEKEQRDAEALLSRFGVAVDDPVVEQFDGETLMNMMEYVHTPPSDTDARNQLVEYIKDNIAEAFDRLGEGDMQEAA